MNGSILTHLGLTAMPAVLADVAVISVAVAVIVVAAAVSVPDLYREARTWLPRERKVIDFDARRRELNAAVSVGNRRIH